MSWFWTWGGISFGFRDGDRLFTYGGIQAGRFEGAEIYAWNGRYLGEIREGGRLITSVRKVTQSRAGFVPKTNMGRMRRMARMGGG
jgi:hypothetical protein